MIKVNMNRFLLPALFLSTFVFAQVKLPSNNRSATPKPSQVVGKANGISIKASDVEPYLWDWYGKPAVEDISSYLVISQEAGRRGLVVSDSEVEKEIDSAVKSITSGSNSSDAAQAAEEIRGQGFTRSRLYLRTKANLLLDKIIMADFHAEGFVKVSTILVRTSTSDAAKIAEAIKKAQSAYDQLEKGASWDTVLASTTTDARLIAAHGALGWRELGAFPDSVQKEISTSKVGAITHPAVTAYGVQIFRIDAEGGSAKGKDFDLLKTMYLRDARPKRVNELKANAHVEVLLK